MTNVITIDTETLPFAPGRMAPKIVCLQYGDEHKQYIVERHQVSDIFRWLASQNCVFNGWNIAYDLVCLAEHNPQLVPLIFHLLDTDRVVDAALLRLMYYVGTIGNCDKHLIGGFKLSEAHEQLTGSPLTGKGHDEQMDFQSLLTTPLSQWPSSKVQYAKNDISAAHKQWQHYTRVYQEHSGSLPLYTPNNAPSGIHAQTRAAFALRATTCHGKRIDPRFMPVLRRAFEQQRSDATEVLRSTGYLNDKGKPDLPKLREFGRQVATFGNLRVKDTKKGALSLDAYTKERLASVELSTYPNAPSVFQAVLDFEQAQDHITKFLDVLRPGQYAALHTSYNTIVASNRTSAYEPNDQQQSNKLPIRESFIARPGMALVARDIKAAELGSYAEVCYQILGYSTLRHWINEDKCPHLGMLAATQGLAYEQLPPNAKKVLANERQVYKILNFGRPGGLGLNTLIKQWHERGLKIDEGTGREYLNRWHAALPECYQLNRYTEQLLEQSNNVFVHPIVGWVRYIEPNSINSAKNGWFQTLTATAAKECHYRIVRECYHQDLKSPLYGFHPWAFVHDESIVEGPADRVHNACERMGQIIVDTVRQYTPNVKPGSDGVAMYRWSKKAEARYQGGTLVPYDPIEHLDAEYRI